MLRLQITILLLIFFTLSGLAFSIEAQTIYVTSFADLQEKKNPGSPAKKIQKEITSHLNNSNLNGVILPGFSAEYLSASSEYNDNDLLIGGYYERTSSGQLNFYAQIYSLKSLKIIDALNELNLYDQVSVLSKKSIKVDDLKISDEDAIVQFSKLITKRINSNPNHQIRARNINENILSSPIHNKVKNYLSGSYSELEKKETFRLLEEQEIITATKTKTTLRDAPAAVYVINKRQIRNRGYRTLIDALHDIPGFDITHVYGIFPELINQRGLVGNNQRTLLYIDGILDNNITENAILAGSIRFPLQNVKRIEVVSGPASALYGANAFNGVINIITEDGKNGDLNQVEVRHGYYESNFRNQGNSISLISNGSVGEGSDEFSYSVHGYYYQTQGPYFGDVSRLNKEGDHLNDVEYDLETRACGQQCIPDENSVGDYWSSLYDVSHEDTYNITARFSRGNFRFQTINWQYLQGQGTFSNATNTIDTNKGEFEGSSWDFRNNSVAMGYLTPFTKNLSLDSEVVVRHTEVLSSSHEDTPLNKSPGYQYRPGEHETISFYERPDFAYELKERLVWNYSRKLNTTLGAETSYSEVPQGYGSEKKYIFKNYAAYVQQFWRILPPLAVTAGYRYDLNSIYGLSHTPRLGFVLSPAEDLTMKLLFSTGFRGPTAWESFNETLQRKANPKLKPERMTTTEAGIAYRFFRKYYFSVQQYYTRINDLLLEVETNEANPNNPGNNYSQNQNVGKAKIYGTEVTGDIQLSRFMDVYLNYTYNQGEYYGLPDTLTQSPSTKGRTGDDYLLDYLNSLNDESRVPDKGPIPNIASHHYNMGVTWHILKDFSWHIRGNYVDIRRTIASNPEKTIEGYVLFHTNFRWDNAFTEGLYLQLLIRNITDERFYDPGIRTATGSFYPTRHPLEGRNIWMSLGYKF